MALTKATAAGQKATEGNLNYISVADGSNYVWLIDNATQSLLTSIRPVATAVDTQAVSEKAIAQALIDYKIAGQFIGSAATFADLPKTSTATGEVTNGDWAVLAVDDIGTGTESAPQYQRGVYLYDGTDYSFIVALDLSGLTLNDAMFQGRTDTNVGSVSGKLAYDRDQAIKGATANFTTTDTDHDIAKPWTAKDLIEGLGSRTELNALLGVSLSDKDLGTFTGATIPDDATVKSALQALEGKLEDLKITGRFIGSSATFATLPTTSTETGAAINKDWAYKSAAEVGTGTAEAPQYPKGVYLYNGSAYSFAFDFSIDLINLTQTQVEDKASTVFGEVSGQRLNQAIVKNTFKGADGTAAGEAGSVPAPTATDNVKYLRGDSTWSDLSIPWVFADKVDVTVAAGSTRPTNAEILTWANSKTPKIRNSFIYYTATSVDSDPEQYTWFIDVKGKVAIMRGREIAAPRWVSGDVVTSGTFRYHAVDNKINALLLMTNAVAQRTTAASFTVSEASSWICISQDFIDTFPADTVVPKGYMIRESGTLYQSKSSHLTPASFNVTETGNWVAISAVSWGFIANTGFTMAVPSRPTVAEMRTRLLTDMSTVSTRNRFFFYTGTDTETDEALYIWLVDITGEIKTIKSPLPNKVAALHDLGVATPTPLKSVNHQTEAHFEGGGGFVINGVNSVDGDYYYLLNTSGSEQKDKLTFSNFAGAYLRNGVSEVEITSPFTIVKGVKYLASVTVNGVNKYLNLVPLADSPTSAIQTLNATGAVSQWGSTVIIGATALTANITLTLPSAATSIGKSIRFIRLDNTTFTVTLAAQAGQTVTLTNNGVELNAQNGAIEVEAITATAIRQVSHSPVLPQVSGLNYLQDIALNCTNVWTARNIGTLTGFADPDANNHYLASRNMVINASVTAMTSEGNGLTIGFNIQVLRAGAWVDTYATTAVTNPSAGVVPFHRDTQIAVRAGESIRFLTNANDGGGNTYPGNRTFRISLNEVPNATIIAPGNTVLTPRAITGSATGTAYDGVPVPVQITPIVGQVLDTVTATAGATISNVNPALWTCNVTANGAATVLSHTAKAGATFTGRQTLGVFRPTTPTDINATVFTTNLDMRTAKWMVISIRDSANATHDSGNGKASWQIAQMDLETLRGNGGMFYFETYDNGHCQGRIRDFATGQVWLGDQVRGIELCEIRVEDDAVNGYVVPTGTTVATPRTVTVTGALGTVNGGAANATIFETFPCQVKIDLAAGRALNTVTASSGTVVKDNELTGYVTVTAGAANVALTVTDKAAATYQGLNLIGEFLPAANTVYDTLATVTTGIDFTRCSHIEAVGRKTSDDRATSSFIPVIIGGTTPTMEFQFSGGQMSCYIANATDAAAGKLTNVDCHGIAFETTAIRGWSMGTIGFSVPTATTLFTPRNITGTGIAANTVGRDNTVSTIRITGLTAGSEILAGNISASGGATVQIVDSGRSGAATVDVIPNGADTAITYTQTVWRRTLTSTVNGSAGTINGVASANVVATSAVDFWLTLPANHLLTGAPTITGGTLAAWSADGSGVITPDNTGNVTVTASSAQPGAKSIWATANAGSWVTFGSIKITMSTAGNRSFNFQSVASGNTTFNWWSFDNWSNGGTTVPQVATVNNTQSTYFNSSYSFGTQGQKQEGIIFDVTAGRRYRWMGVVGAAYNGNIIVIEEIT